MPATYPAVWRIIAEARGLRRGPSRVNCLQTYSRAVRAIPKTLHMRLAKRAASEGGLNQLAGDEALGDARC